MRYMYPTDCNSIMIIFQTAELILGSGEPGERIYFPFLLIIVYTISLLYVPL